MNRGPAQTGPRQYSGVRLVVRTPWLHHGDLSSILGHRSISTSGTSAALTALVPDHPHRDWAPTQITVLGNIAHPAPSFQSPASGPSLNMDWAHEYPLSREAN